MKKFIVIATDEKRRILCGAVVHAADDKQALHVGIPLIISFPLIAKCVVRAYTYDDFETTPFFGPDWKDQDYYIHS